MNKNKINYKIINAAALVILLYVGFLTIKIWWGLIAKCISILWPFIVGFAFAYAFTPLVRWFEKKGLNKGLSVITVLLILLVIVFGLTALVVPLLYDQLKLLINHCLSIK